MESEEQKVKPDIRYLNDMKEVVYDREWLKTALNLELYYMYRGVKEKEDLRYDITVIPAQMLGKEFVKTKGHYHIGNCGELYIVLKGKAIYLMQKEENGKIIDVYYVRAEEGDYISIPPQYGHISINPHSEELKMANWISKECKSNYEKIENKKGGCYYYTKSGWVKNENYQNTPELYSKEPEKSMPKNLNFLRA
ncbi:MAG: glucose-6-phosphate isomerase [Patescibacteria group bacterium]|nr:glucose-6-phosphate isomerase [Patescibacteria group bacterium]